MSHAIGERDRNPAARILTFFLLGLIGLPAGTVLGKEPARDQIARMVYIGQFDSARKLLNVPSASVTNRPSDPLADQLQKLRTLDERRQAMRSETYGKNVKIARDYLAKGKIEKALTAARKARYYAPVPKAFGKIDWVRGVADQAKVQAAEYLKKHEWLKAGNIYAELATIYEDDKTYDKLTRDCAVRVRFEATYKPKSDWKDQVRNITIDVLSDICHYIANYYVETPDFGKMVLTGLQSVGTLTEVPKLTQVFPALADPAKAGKFDEKIKALKEQVRTETKTKPADKKLFYQAVIKLIVINGETINLPQEVIIKEFVDAALGELDPFTNVIWPAELDDFDKHTTGRFSGVGIQLSMENNKLKVVTPIPGTPAYGAGILPGDFIVSINGETTDGITIDQAVRRITGPKNTRVILGIQNPWTNKTRQVPLVRDTIVIQTVKGWRLDRDNHWQFLLDPPFDQIAYLRITNFTDDTVPELASTLKILKKQGAKGLIVDLRFNPGGTLKAAVETVDLFVSKGVIVSTRGRNVDSWERSASSGAQMTQMPVVVLINNLSASAAEIVAGALKDFHRAWLIGERSFGKGSVQNVLGLVDNTLRMKLTTAFYYLPSGTCIHRKTDSKQWGVEPNLKVELTPREFKDVIDLERDAEIVSQVNGHKTSLPASQAKSKPKAATQAKATTREADDDEEEEEDDSADRRYPPVDLQIQTAIAVLRARLDLNVPWENLPAATAPATAPTSLPKTVVNVK